MELIKRVKEFITKFSLILDNEKLVVGVSGGPDSIFLIHILINLGFKNLIVAHLNHKLRGLDADMDEVFVRHLSQKLMIPLYVGREDVLSFCKKNRYSIEEGARIKRLDFLKRVKEREKMDKIALGHNLDDQVETVLMNFIRGSGLKGLSGILPKAGDFIHPILSIKRDEIVRYLDNKNIPYRIDKTNLSLDYLRNRIRNYLIPIIEKEFNKKFKERVFSLSDIVRVDDEFLNKITEEKVNKILKFDIDSVKVNVKEFNELHLSIKRRLIRKIVENLKGDLREYSLKNIDDVISLFYKKSGKKVELSDRIIAIKEYDSVVFEKKQKDSFFFKETYIKIPGKTKTGGILIETVIKDSFKAKRDRFLECLDFDKLKIPLKIRLPKRGERFNPLGMKGKKKLKEFFIDERIPRSVRWKIPVITDKNDEILWVVGVRISDKFKITNLTKRVLCIKIKLEDDRWKRIFKRF